MGDNWIQDDYDGGSGTLLVLVGHGGGVWLSESSTQWVSVIG